MVGRGVPGRPTVTISGRGAEGYAARRAALPADRASTAEWAAGRAWAAERAAARGSTAARRAGGGSTAGRAAGGASRAVRAGPREPAATRSAQRSATAVRRRGPASSAARHRQLRPHERANFKPDRAAMWAVVLCVLLLVVAVASAHGAVLPVHAIRP